MDGQGTTWRRNIAENFNRLSNVHQRYRLQTTDGRAVTYSEREHELIKPSSVGNRNENQSMFSQTARVLSLLAL